MDRFKKFDCLIGLDEENRKDGWSYRFAIIVLFIWSLYFYGYGYGSIYLLANEKTMPDLVIPIELQEQLQANQNKFNDHKAGMLKAKAANEEILEKVLKLNNIIRQPNEEWILTSDGKKWNLFKKNKW